MFGKNLKIANMLLFVKIEVKFTSLEPNSKLLIKIFIIPKFPPL